MLQPFSLGKPPNGKKKAAQKAAISFSLLMRLSLDGL